MVAYANASTLPSSTSKSDTLPDHALPNSTAQATTGPIPTPQNGHSTPPRPRCHTRQTSTTGGTVVRIIAGTAVNPNEKTTSPVTDSQIRAHTANTVRGRRRRTAPATASARPNSASTCAVKQPTPPAGSPVFRQPDRRRRHPPRR
jgi:hypothetical protein